MKYFTLTTFSFLLYATLTAQNIHWANVINTTYNDFVYDLQVDKDHNLVICGLFSGTVDFDPGPGVANLVTMSTNDGDIFLAKYDSAGNYMWAIDFGTGFLNDEGDRIAIDTSGNIFITGMFGGTVDFDPDPGNTASISAPGSSRSRFLAKYDPSGNFIAVKHVGNAVGVLPSSQDGQSGLGCDADGNVYMSGFYGTSLTLAPGTTLSVSGLSDNYFSKFDPQLNLIFGHRIGSNETEYSQGMFVHPTGRIIVLGSFRNTVDFDPGPGIVNLTQVSNTQDGYFASYDSSGQLLFVKQLAAGTSATPIATLIDSDNNILVTGSCAGTMDADPGTGTATIGAGFNDQAFVAAYDSIGNYRWAFAFGDIGAYNAIRYVGVDTVNNIYVSGNYNPMVDVDPGADTIVFGNKYGDYVASYDTAGNFRTGFLLQDGKMRLKHDDIYLTGGFYGLVDFDPGPQVYNLQSDTINASWFLVRMHICDAFTQIPDAINIPPVCEGDTITLSATGGGPQYNWTLPAGITAIGTTTDSLITVVINAGATAGDVFVNSVGSCLNSPMIYASLNVNQAVIPSIVQSGDSLFATGTVVAWQWFLNNTLIAGAIDSFYVPLVSGIYAVMTTDSNGCTALSDTLNFVVSGIDQAENNDFSIYPNPFTNKINIRLMTQVDEIIITDITGRKIYSQIMKPFAVPAELMISTETWSNGIYYLNADSVRSKIIKQ